MFFKDRNLSNCQGLLLGQVANVFKLMCLSMFVRDSCGCVIILFLGLKHELTLLSDRNLSHFQELLLGQVANVFKLTFLPMFARDSCGCVIILFLGLKHELTLLSHDVVRARPS